MNILNKSKVATRLPVQDLERARRFYAEKLGFEINDIAEFLNILSIRDSLYGQYVKGIHICNKKRPTQKV
jgi:catechol 2,3-dioxygenase-like lactoylglutathione lyase family enzyme